MNAACTESTAQFPPLLGQAPRFRELRERLPLIARAQRTTLITGPTGSGKDVIARCLHAQSERRARPYVTVHCAALPESLIEAEMFGHCRGAFTGAVQTRGGLVRSAGGGTLFLDEIDSLPAGAQAKLLRFLETGEYRAVGADHTEYSNAWVIAATNANLGERVQAGTFRADLMYRLAVIQVPVPSLRERTQDIAALAQHFLEQVDPSKGFEREAVRAMESYDWPGNVRELKHRVESAALLAHTSIIDAQSLCLGHVQVVSPRPTTRVEPGLLDPPIPSEISAACAPLERELWELVNGGGLTLAQAIGECERLLVRAALRAERENRTRAANRLGIHVRTIFKKLRDD
jgi:DNA-binding NtrC family response regulator